MVVEQGDRIVCRVIRPPSSQQVCEQDWIGQIVGDGFPRKRMIALDKQRQTLNWGAGLMHSKPRTKGALLGCGLYRIGAGGSFGSAMFVDPL